MTQCARNLKSPSIKLDEKIFSFVMLWAFFLCCSCKLIIVFSHLFQVASTSVFLLALWAPFWHCHWTCSPREWCSWEQHCETAYALALTANTNMAPCFLVFRWKNLTCVCVIVSLFSFFSFPQREPAGWLSAGVLCGYLHPVRVY